MKWPVTGLRGCVQLIAALFLLLAALSAAAGERVRVGVYENSPKIALSPAGKPEGIFVDLIEAIAEKEGWEIEYVPGTWQQGLDRLAAGQIDLMPDVALNAERARLYAFHHEPVLSSWSQVYARHGSGIRSLPDLEGRRVAVLGGSAQEGEFRSMIDGFGLRVELLPLPDFASAFRAVADGRADAVVTNRFYGMGHAGQFGLEDTAIVFAPTRLFFAAPRASSPARLQAIDRHLVAFKQDSGSVYFRSLRHWTGEELAPHLPSWLAWAALAILVLVVSAFVAAGLMRRQVKARTAELDRRNEEMAILNRTLRATGSSLDLQTVLDETTRGALELTGCDGGVLCVRDPQQGLMRVEARIRSCNETDRAPDGGPLRDAACPAMLEGVMRGKSHLVLRAGAPGTPQPCGNVADASVRWNIYFSLQAQGNTVGLLCLFSRQDDPPSEHALESVRELCVPVALAMENVRLYEQTRRHAAELERRVEARTRELAEAKHAAEAADRLKSAFLATMSHELRTPLNSIIGFTGILLQELAGPLNSEQRKQLEMVQNSSRHLLALINDVLDISKIEAGELTVAAEPFDLAESIARVAGIAAPLAEKKGLALRVDAAASLGELVGDARRVEQVLLNLLSNAIKFTERGSVTLSVDTTDDGGAVRLHVQDTGIGIKPEDMAQLFQPFRQLDSTLTRAHEGTGLGLAICRRLAALMGGRIEAESRWGEGSTFTLTLPMGERHP